MLMLKILLIEWTVCPMFVYRISHTEIASVSPFLMHPSHARVSKNQNEKSYPRAHYLTHINEILSRKTSPTFPQYTLISSQNQQLPMLQLHMSIHSTIPLLCLLLLARWLIPRSRKPIRIIHSSPVPLDSHRHAPQILRHERLLEGTYIQHVT